MISSFVYVHLTHLHFMCSMIRYTYHCKVQHLASSILKVMINEAYLTPVISKQRTLKNIQILDFSLNAKCYLSSLI